MNDLENLKKPESIDEILDDTKKINFKMSSEPLVGSLLRTLAASKNNARFLELGTGTGLSTAWILDGMSENSTLLTMDNDQNLLDVAAKYLGDDSRLSIVCDDGDNFVKSLSEKNAKFDFIFSDTWAGKYQCLEEVLDMLNPHGIYVIDDMNRQPNWPDDHPPKVAKLLEYLDLREDFHVTKMSWSCGIVICTKI